MNTSLLFLTLLTLPVSSFSQAGSLREECLARVDALHSCACEDVRGDKRQDGAAFDLNRPDIQQVYQGFRKYSHYQEALDARLVASLKRAYNEQRELLACHDRVGMKLEGHFFSEDYCIHEPKAAKAARKPVCDSIDQTAAQARAGRIVRAGVNQVVGTFRQEIEELSYCSQTITRPMLNSHVVATRVEPCKMDLKSLFPDNESILTEAQANKIVAYIKNHECYKQYVRDGLKLQKVEIESSSSRLANTGDAANKTFLQLSEERAREIDTKIVQAVFDASILSKVTYDKNAKGENGDGTSGACPYAYDSVKQNWIRKPFPTASQLEVNKRTDLNLYFGDENEYRETKEADVHTDMMTIPCKHIEYYCR